MESSTEETTADSVRKDYYQQEETKNSGTNYSTAPRMSTLGSTTSRFISTQTVSSEHSTTVRRVSSLNTTTIAGGVAGGLGLLILVLLVKVYVRQRKIIKERDILMMSMYLTPRQTPLKKHRFKNAASKDEVNTEEDETEQERDSYMEPFVHRHIWQLLDMSSGLPRRPDETETEQDTMYSSIRISENTAQRLQYIARCMGPTDAALKKQSITSTILQTSVNADYSHVKAPGAKQMELDHGPRWSTDTNHYEFVEGSTVDDTEEEDTVIYDDVIIEQTERVRYTKPPKVGDNFNARMVRPRSTDMVSEECPRSHPKRLTTAPRNSTVDLRASVIDSVKPFTYKLVGEMKLVSNEG